MTDEKRLAMRGTNKEDRAGDSGTNHEKVNSIAPGNDFALNRDATKEEIKKGDFTKVYRLSYDEVDESFDESSDR